MVKKQNFSSMQSRLTQICRAHFIMIVLYGAYTILSDATHLITPQLVLQRWTVNAALLVGVSLIWYQSRFNNHNQNFYRNLFYALICLDVMLASFNVYTQRGMASRAVALFVLPIVVSAVLAKRSAIFVVACISTAAYSLSAVKYFVDNFNEGYKAELYIEVGFYCAVFFIIAAILNILVKYNKTTSD